MVDGCMLDGQTDKWVDGQMEGGRGRRDSSFGYTTTPYSLFVFLWKSNSHSSSSHSFDSGHVLSWGGLAISLLPPLN